MKTTAVILGLVFAAIATAQDVDVRVATEKPPHYVGVPAIVQLTVEGLQSDPDPKCTVESDSPEIRAELAGISPRIMQRMFQSGNQIRRIEQVTHIIQFQITASKPGEHEVGPFVIAQNGVEKRVDAIKMSFQQVPTTDDMRVKLVLPKTAYPDQRVLAEIQWWYAGDTENVKRLTIAAPIFDQFQFAADPPPPRGGSRLPIQTDQGTVSLAATATDELADDKRFTVVSAKRTLIPSRPGTYQIAPVTATIELVTQWDNRRRSPFGFGGSLFDEAFGGNRRAAKVELYRAADEPMTFQVLPFPTGNRPESFSGAVGKGFSLAVSADRTVVRVGEPIRLTLDLRGDGNLEGAALPGLSADGGLDPDRFRVPKGGAAGVFDSQQGTKQFVVSVRVLDESINEIPAIAYSWFDPEDERYQTTYSKPIALRVMPTQIVGADSVVSSRAKSTTAGLQTGKNGMEDSPTTGIGSSSFGGVDLSIENDSETLLRRPAPLLSNVSLQFAGYALGSLCLVVAVVDRRRRQIDPAVRRSSAIMREQRNRITAAAQLPEKKAARQIADALQIAAAQDPSADRSTIQNIMSECDAIAFSPHGDNKARIASNLIDRAVASIADLKTGGEAA